MSKSQDTPVPAHGIVSAYRDAEGWILYGADQEPIEVWPEHWTERVTKQFLLSQGIEVEGEKPATEDSSVADSILPLQSIGALTGWKDLPDELGWWWKWFQSEDGTFSISDLRTELVDPSALRLFKGPLGDCRGRGSVIKYKKIALPIPIPTTTDPDFGEVVDTRFEPDSHAQAREIIHRLRTALEKTACECHGPHICTRCETLHPEKLKDGTVGTPAR